ncbi:MAG: hypothetical protein ABJL44_00255 [Algibacter sp.]
MKTILYSFVFAFLFSCGNEKTVLLPEINHSEITEIQDVSAGYLFYNETEKDSVELNRKNLISTTNWLINVDKRLTLKQVIPHIKYLQEKKQNSSHKNKDAKNYFTCNDTSRKDLGFIEFTSINYHKEKPKFIPLNTSDLNYSPNVTSIHFDLNKNISITNRNRIKFDFEVNKKKLLNELKQIDSIKGRIILFFSNDILFQDYINYKYLLSKNDFKHLTISPEEYLFN